jgi:type I restriction enzyme R subunit
MKSTGWPHDQDHRRPPRTALPRLVPRAGLRLRHGPDLAVDGDTPERRDYLQVVLTGRLLSSLHKINPHIPLATIEEAAQAITKPESPVLIHNNRAFHKLLLEGVQVEYRDGDDTKADHVQLIDFHNVEKNQFLVVNQFTVLGAKQLRRPDIVVFINGLPIAVRTKKPRRYQCRCLEGL